ncbi:MAG: hypothetical protein ACI85F_002469 [Bacteroidia bacterium]|jgi:hypothetical protein
MKAIISAITAFAMICPFIAFGQGVPQKMNYQAVARTADGSVIADQEVALQIAIISADNLLYSEQFPLLKRQ